MTRAHGLRRRHASRLAALLTAVLAAAALHTGTANAQATVYRLDPAHSFVDFEVQHFGTSTISGRFGPVLGVVVLDPAAGRGEVGLRIATANVSTGLAVFDARLRQADLLASDAFPDAFFVATRFQFEADRLTDVRGEFTWRGVSQPLSLHAQRFACRTVPAEAAAAGAPAGRICGGDFEAEILRSTFGATFGLPFVGDRVRLRVRVEGTAP